jgi:biotin carboxyl carrier protein
MSRALRVSIPGEPGLEPVDLEPGDGAPAILLEPDGRASIPVSREPGDTATGARTSLWSRLPARQAGVHRIEVVVDGWRFEVEVEDARRAALRDRATRRTQAAGSSGPTEIRAIIPGRVAAVRIVAGDTVDAGTTLLVVEAMKMQNELRAPRGGRVERVAVGEGQTIETGDLLVVIE